jgi:hypothetical protein
MKAAILKLREITRRFGKGTSPLPHKRETKMLGIYCSATQKQKKIRKCSL